MNSKEKELLRKCFENGEKKVFDDNKTAAEVAKILKENDIAFTLGSFEHEVNGKSMYNHGIIVEDMNKLNTLLAE